MILCVATTASLLLISCDKKSGEAQVVAKEHIAAAEVSATPTEAAQAGDSPQPKPSPVRPRALAADEIAMDGYVMKATERGTSKDPRALPSEQWIVTVKLLSNGLQFNVQTDRSRWERTKIADRVHVQYSQGKYTGTVWNAQLK